MSGCQLHSQADAAVAGAPLPRCRIFVLGLELPDCSTSFASRARNTASTAASSAFRLPTAASKLTLGLRFDHDKVSVHVGIQNLGMNVTLAANCRRVAKSRRYLFFDSATKIAFRLRSAIETLKLGEGHRRQNRSRPSAEILRRDVLSSYFLEIVIYKVASSWSGELRLSQALDLARIIHGLSPDKC